MLYSPTPKDDFFRDYVMKVVKLIYREKDSQIIDHKCYISRVHRRGTVAFESIPLRT